MNVANKNLKKPLQPNINLSSKFVSKVNRDPQGNVIKKPVANEKKEVINFDIEEAIGRNNDLMKPGAFSKGKETPVSVLPMPL